MEKIKIKKVLVYIFLFCFICPALGSAVAGTNAEVGNILGYMYGWWSYDALNDPSFEITNYSENNGTFTIGSGSANQYYQYRVFNAQGNYFRSLFFLPFNANSNEVFSITFTIYSGGSNAPVTDWNNFFSGGISAGNTSFSNNSSYPSDSIIKSLISSANTDEGYTNLPTSFDKIVSSTEGYNTFSLNGTSTSTCEVTLNNINFGDDYNVKFISFSCPISYNPENIYITINSIGVTFTSSDTASVNNRLDEISSQIGSQTVTVTQNINNAVTDINNQIDNSADQITNKVESVGETVASKIDDLDDTISSHYAEEESKANDNVSQAEEFIEDAEVDKLPNQDNLFNQLRNFINAFVNNNTVTSLTFPSVTIPILNITTDSYTCDFSRWLNNEPLKSVIGIIQGIFSLFIVCAIMIRVYRLAEKVLRGDSVVDVAQDDFKAIVSSDDEPLALPEKR